MKNGPENLFEKDSNEPQNQKTMKTFIGSKLVKAKPMTRKDFLEQVTGEGIGDRPDSPGYLVEYPDGYQSWNVPTEFEKISRVITDDEYRSFFGVESDGSLDENGFQWYIQTKVVNAEPIIKANDSDNREEKTGYEVIYPNGHESWSPAVKFEEAYREISGLEHKLYMDAISQGDTKG